MNLEGAQGLSDEMICAFEADFQAEHKDDAIGIAAAKPHRDQKHFASHLSFARPFSWCQAATKEKLYFISLSSPAKPGWDAHLSERCNLSKVVMRMRTCEERLNVTVGGISKGGFAVMCTYIVMRTWELGAESGAEYWKRVYEEYKLRIENLFYNHCRITLT